MSGMTELVDTKRPRTLAAISLLAALLLAVGMLGLWLTREPVGVQPVEHLDAVTVVGVHPGMASETVRTVLASKGWVRGAPDDQRLSGSGVLRAEELYRRRDGDLVEALGVDYVLHPSGQWASTVHYAALSGTVQVVGGGGAELSDLDQRFETMQARLTGEAGEPAYSGEGRVEAWWMCCRDRNVAWNNGVGLRLRFGLGFRMLTVGWSRDALIQAVDAETGVGRDWAESERVTTSRTGSAALRDLMERGALRPATHEDARVWLEQHVDWAGPAIQAVAGGSPERLRRILGLGPDERRGRHYDAYVVRAPLTRLPEGFEDGRPRQFLVPKGISLPGGDWGSHQVYSIDGGVCRTGGGQCAPHARVFRAYQEVRRAGHEAMKVASH